MSALAERLKERPPRTWLFVPALRAPEWIPKAMASGADGLVVDLEDATAPSEKDLAREVVRGLALAPRDGPAIVVRVNSDPDVLEPDCAAAVASGADGIIVPKGEGPFAIRRAAMFLAQTETDRELAIIPMIETARSVLVALELAEADMRVAALGFGGGDLSAEVGWTRTREGEELAQARAMVVLAAGARGLGSIDTPWLDIADTAGAANEARHVARLGFTGKFVIHPSHVGPVSSAFTPSEEEVAHARGLLEAFDRAIGSGSGVATYQGHMIDDPDARQARRVLARASVASRSR